MVNVDAAAGAVRTACFLSSSPERTRALAALLGSVCRGGETVLLFGDLGAGKTCFVQGLALGLGVPSSMPVTSPTFTLHAEYRGRLYLNHLDLYRLDAAESLERLGVGDLLADREAVTAIEWPELLAGGAGNERLEVRLVDRGGDERALEAAAFGAEHARLLAAWQGSDHERQETAPHQ